MQRAAALVIALLFLSGCMQSQTSAEIQFPGQPEPSHDREFDPVPWVMGLVFLGLVVGVIAAAAAGAGQRQQQQQQVVVIREPRRED